MRHTGHNMAELMYIMKDITQWFPNLFCQTYVTALSEELKYPINDITHHVSAVFI